MAIDLNNTSVEELERKLGLRKHQAENIYTYIEDNGKIIDESELLNVPGIGKLTFERIEEDVYVGDIERPPKMSTHKYREKHKRAIQRARRRGDKLDVCHIISHHNGGADHEDNYVLAGAHFNREIQDKHDNLMCALVGVKKTQEAIRISRLQKDYERSVYDAEELVESGEEDFKTYYETYQYEEEEEMISIYDEGLDGDRVHRRRLRSSYYCKHVIRVWNHGCGKLRREEGTADMVTSDL